MSNVLVTNKGMDFVTSAHNNGIYIDVRYFVPVYDDRIDGNVRDNINLSSFTQIADPDVTTSTVIGEVLWKRSNLYNIDNSNKYIISSTDFPNGLYQKATVATNFNNNQPLSDQISASSWTFSGSNGSYNVTANGGSNGVTGLANVTAVDNSTAWTTVGYHAVYDSADQERARGNFSCLFQQSLMGNFKFNKILLFAVAVQEGSSNPVDTCLFAEAYISATQEISNLGAGFDTVELDVQIDISGVSASFEDLFYSSSADYWTHAPAVSGKGLHFDGLIGVNSYDDNQAAIAGVMHLRKERVGVGLDIVEDIPILRLDYDNNRYTSIDVSEDQYDVTESTTATVGKIGTDIIIKVANWNSYCGDAIAIRPKIGSTVALGTTDYPFRQMFLSNYLVLDGEKNNDSIIPLVIDNWYANYAIKINGESIGSLLIGNSLGRLGSYTDDLFSIRISGLGIEIADDVESRSDYLYGSFKGGDLWRESQNLLIYNTYCKPEFTGYGIENVYMFAGLNLSATYTSVDGQTGPTHKNIIYEIEQKSAGLFCSTNSNLASTAELILGAKGNIGLFGPVELRNIGTNNNTALLLSKTLAGSSYVGDYNLVIGAGFEKSTTLYTNIISKANELDSMQDLLNDNSKLFLIAKTVYFDSSIIPLTSYNSNIGSDEYRWGYLYNNGIITNAVYSTYIQSQINIVSNANINATSGYYEKNRQYRLGEWSESTTDVGKEYIKSTEIKLKDLLNYVTGNSLGLTGTFTLDLNLNVFPGVTKTATITATGDHTLNYLLSQVQITVTSDGSPPENWNGLIGFLTQNLSNQEYSIESGKIKTEQSTQNTLGVQLGNVVVFTWVGDSSPAQLTSEIAYGYTRTISQSYSKVGDTFFVNGYFTGNGLNNITITLPNDLERASVNSFFQGSVFASTGSILDGSYIESVSTTQFKAGGFTFSDGIFYYYSLVYRGKSGT